MARASYYIVVEHKGLGKWREIKGTDKYLVEQKARVQEAQWNNLWMQKLLKEEEQYKKQNRAIAEQKRKQVLLTEKERQRQELDDLRQDAFDKTQEAKQAIEDIQSILKHTLLVNDAVDWEKFKNNTPFNKKKPDLAFIYKSPDIELPRNDAGEEPVKEDFLPKPTLLSKVIKSIRVKQEHEAESAYAAAMNTYNSALERWQARCSEVVARNAMRQNEYEQRKASAQQSFEKDLQAWEQEKQHYEAKRTTKNIKVEERKAAYLSKEADAILDYCEIVLSASVYPDNFPQDFDLEYQDDTGILVVNYKLPALEDIPRLSEVKFVQSSRTFKESFLNEKAISALYDEAIYQIALRTLHELFEADVVDALKSIVLNGLVTAIDKSIGKEVTTCILSIHAKKEDFLKINLANVDAKTCFKSLKGVGSSKLHGMTAVAPILNISREDSRFVDSYDVANSLDSSVNLAAMDWEDFEHLIREIFAKEFSANGGEVKVTQASRDGGVDAIAFDPDPIRGGKIVIQAKRYTNTVGVSAVRDLFGTVQHEGATKGVLVTTADYGPDAYEFIAGKPLSLLNGANLLHLLEKHGHSARIDMREAKKTMASLK